MKNILINLLYLSLLIVLNLNASIAQTNKNDTIIKIDGNKIAVIITNTNEKDVSYTFPGETMTNTLSKNRIREIIYSSGRKEILNSKVEINGEKDWEKVKFTTVANEVEGLTKKGELTEDTAYLGPYTPKKKATEKLETAIKKNAAKLKAHIVLITPISIQGNKYIINGVAFGYE